MNGHGPIALRVSDLHFAYGDGQPALNGVSFSIAPGEKVALLGPNGAGKSTLLLHLNGLLTGRGIVEVMGQRLVDGDSKLLRRVRAQVGLIFQDPDDQLFSNSVYEDVAFGPVHMGLPAEQVEQRVRSALADVGLEGFEKRAPYHLSGGEKRRAAIATVLSMEPQIIAADEPSSGLDPRARRGLIALLERLPQTLLVATHDLELARTLLPRSIILDGGKVAADGPTEQLVSDRALLEAHGL
jgi:cobalt/nickel transport system ATP-binding protein